jgi:hypothetical protein
MPTDSGPFPVHSALTHPIPDCSLHCLSWISLPVLQSYSRRYAMFIPSLSTAFVNSLPRPSYVFGTLPIECRSTLCPGLHTAYEKDLSGIVVASSDGWCYYPLCYLIKMDGHVSLHVPRYLAPKQGLSQEWLFVWISMK